ncbi:cytosolic carboxypeptidase 4-like isoform X3 [Zootermopsis nevadensis]|uniref:cytosolic carboxypeptidase 4-like isoform X3 n=1 Tax=Zootermopsis nevadensis TaxID=136037 RepID=UPI000B8ED18C|nr:cytosolic carboxypeptidase 4-like isoform X3 [Zootermopsis nevadensis]
MRFLVCGCVQWVLEPRSFGVMQLVVKDQATACSLAGILHECVAPKSGKSRSSAISQLVSMNASQSVVKLIMQQQTKYVVLSDTFMLELMWLLAQLAQRDSKFSVKTRLVGATKTFHNVLRTYCNNTKLLYPVLLVIKCLARSSSTTSLLVKDGIVATMEKIIVCIGFTPNSKLRLSLNVINYLTKSRPCCIQTVKSGLLILLLRIFERWDRYEGRIHLKICSYIIMTLQHLCSTKIGRKSVCTHNGLTLLHKFSTHCPEDKSYDSVLARVCYIINICLDRKQLPVQSTSSPAIFTLPTLKEVYRYNEIDITGKHASSSHEASPGSDEDSCEDSLQEEAEEDDDSDDSDGNDDKDNECYKEEYKNKICNLPLPAQRDVEDLLGYSHYLREFGKLEEKYGRSILLKSSTSCDTSLPSNGKNQFIQKNCKENCHENILNGTVFNQVFPCKTPSFADHCQPLKKVLECSKSLSDDNISLSKNHSDIQNTAKSVSSVLSTLDTGKNGVTMESTATRSNIDNHMMVKGLGVISDIPKDSGFPRVYAKIASRVNSILPFIKIAYPDMMGSDSSKELEPLNIKDRRVCRAKLLACVERGFSEFEGSNKVVYELDTLITELPPQRQNSSTNRLLVNSDELHLGQKDGTKSHLCFESRFESGNLRKVIQISPKEYDLILMPDVNSSHHHQWFYFEVSNMESNFPYVFNIVNCEKQNSQFNYGMKPIMYSVRESVLGRPGWVRVGTDICYYRNWYQNITSRKPRSYLTTAFTIAFPHSYDVCYIAYHYPYTYSQLLAQIWKWSVSVDSTSIYFRAESICSSLNNNETPLITVTAAESETNSVAMREIIFLTARVHPGESNSSWVMQGTLEKLLSNSPAAVSLRSKYVFKIIPMLNMEGVINGCHRCGLTNEDLNRRWSHPNKYLHPVIYHTKGLLEYCVFVLKKPPYVFCDYHGHSRRKNVFLYGCSNSDSWSDIDRSVPDNPADYLLLPHLMQHFSPAFSLQLCSFRVERERESTARVTLWREFGIKRSYTMESSYCGCDQGLYEGYHVNTICLKEIGEHFCDALACLHNESCWRKDVTTCSPGPLRLDLQGTLTGPGPEVIESERSDCSECEEEHC